MADGEMDKKLMKRLIVGCGYLGMRAASYWRASGDKVSILTRSLERASALRLQGFHTIFGDVMDSISLTELPDSDTIFYSVGFDRLGGYSKRAVYIDGLRNTLSCVVGRTDRLIYISSTSVYGQSSGELVDEASITEAAEESGRICNEAESVVWHFFDRTHNNRAIILRLAGIYGPGRLLARVEQLKSQAPLTGNPEAWLNLIHIDDATRTAIAASERGKPGQIYLVCDDRPIHRHQYYSALAERIGAPLPIFANIAADSPELSSINKRCTNRKIRQELGVDLQFPSIIEGLNSLPEVMQPQERLRRE